MCCSRFDRAQHFRFVDDVEDVSVPKAKKMPPDFMMLTGTKVSTDSLYFYFQKCCFREFYAHCAICAARLKMLLASVLIL